MDYKKEVEALEEKWNTQKKEINKKLVDKVSEVKDYNDEGYKILSDTHDQAIISSYLTNIFADTYKFSQEESINANLYYKDTYDWLAQNNLLNGDFSEYISNPNSPMGEVGTFLNEAQCKEIILNLRLFNNEYIKNRKYDYKKLYNEFVHNYTLNDRNIKQTSVVKKYIEQNFK